MPSDVFPDIRQLSDEELLRQKQIQQQRAAERNAKIAKAVDDFSSRTAENQAARREAVGNAINNVKDVGKALYYLTLGSTDPNNPYVQQQIQAQPQPAQQPQVQTPPAQVTAPPAQSVRPAVQRPVQRPVARPVERTTIPTQPQAQQTIPVEEGNYLDNIFFGDNQVNSTQNIEQKLEKAIANKQQSQSQEEDNYLDDLFFGNRQNEYAETNEPSTYGTPVTDEVNMQVAEHLMQPKEKRRTVTDILNQIKTGYDDNRDNGFAIENLQRDTSKSGWNRFGEALGTATRMAGNPLVQGLAAGAINGAINRDWGKGLEYGLQYAQNKAKSDAYEKMMGRRPSILGGYGTDDYKAYNDAIYKQGRLETDKQRADAYDRNIDSQIQQRAEKLKIDLAKLNEQIRHNKAGESAVAARLGISREKAKAYIDHIKWQEKNNGNMTPYQKMQVASQKYKNQLERIKNIEDKDVRNAAYEKAYQEYEDSLAFNADDDSDIWENED